MIDENESDKIRKRIRCLLIFLEKAKIVYEKGTLG